MFDVAKHGGAPCPYEHIYIDLLETFSEAVDQRAGKHLTINVTGAVGALMLEIELPAAIMRWIAVISRCRGLAGHIQEEHAAHSARKIWTLVEENIPYRDATTAEQRTTC